jgi:hypothetical protein
MKAGIRISAGAALCALALGLGTVGSATATEAGNAGAAKRADCSPTTVSQATSTYASYVQTLTVKNTSCKKGWKVVRAFHECRKENGGKNGRCKSRVLGYKCNEGKRNGVSGVRYTAKVKCKRGAKVVKHLYQMNL